jgi:hypothetical protein
MALVHSRDRGDLHIRNRLSAIFFAVGLVFLFLNWTRGYGDTSKWKLFSNQAGWTIKYPPDWKIASCHACPDPTEPDVFVNFFPPRDTSSGWVMITPLEDKPPSTTLDAWLNDIKQRANPNPEISEERLTLGDLPALKVRYRNPSDGGREVEDVYVVSGLQTFSISFGGQKPGRALEKYGNYTIYVEMVGTFRMKH